MRCDSLVNRHTNRCTDVIQTGSVWLAQLQATASLTENNHVAHIALSTVKLATPTSVACKESSFVFSLFSSELFVSFSSFWSTSFSRSSALSFSFFDLLSPLFYSEFTVKLKRHEQKQNIIKGMKVSFVTTQKLLLQLFRKTAPWT